MFARTVATHKHILGHTIQQRKSLAMIQCKSPLATLNPLQIALLPPQHSVCAYSVSIGSKVKVGGLKKCFPNKSQGSS